MENARDFDPPDPRMIDMSPRGMMASTSRAMPSDALHQLHRATGANLEVPGRSVRLSALGLRRNPHGSVKQIHHEELEDSDKERPSPFPKIILKQTDSAIHQFHGPAAGPPLQHPR